LFKLKPSFKTEESASVMTDEQHSKEEVVREEPRTVFNLPQNPLAMKSFKY
jgi:hypothetical protein